jgi:hypothetical protein
VTKIRIKASQKLTPFIVRKGGSQIEFAEASPSDSTLADFQDLRVCVSWQEVRRLSERISCSFSKEAIYPHTLEDYSRLLVYCAVRPVIPQSKISDLIEIVLGLNGYDLSYWSMHFKRAFWSENSNVSLMRTATAFKHLFGLV